METEKQRAQRKNTELQHALADALLRHGYLAVYLGGTKVHAARSTIRGHSGYDHPRALCQPHTPQSYASHYDEHREVTCLRCIASLNR